MTIKRRTIAPLAAAAVALMLAGCAGGTGGAQTQEQACGLILTELVSVTEDLNAGLSEFSSDPQLGVQALEAASTQLNTLETQITEPTALAALADANDKLEVFVADVSAAANGEAVDQAQLTESSTAMQAAFSNIDVVCPQG